MVINGASRRHGGPLAAYLSREGQGTNERVMVIDIQHTLSTDLHGALREMDALASGSRCRNHLYHANINTHPREVLSPDDWRVCADVLAEELGLAGHQRVIVLHEKRGSDGTWRQHAHVVWNRVDSEDLKATHMGLSFCRHERAARRLERRFAHRVIPGPHIDPVTLAVRPEPLEPAPPVEAEKVRADLTAAWRRADSGRAWRAAIEDIGYRLAKGDRRDFVVIDAAGEIHSPRRRIDGVRAKDIRSRLSDIDPETLPGIPEARRLQEQRSHAGQGEDRAAGTRSPSVEQERFAGAESGIPPPDISDPPGDQPQAKAGAASSPLPPEQDAQRLDRERTGPEEGDDAQDRLAPPIEDSAPDAARMGASEPNRGEKGSPEKPAKYAQFSDAPGHDEGLALPPETLEEPPSRQDPPGGCDTPEQAETPRLARAERQHPPTEVLQRQDREEAHRRLGDLLHREEQERGSCQEDRLAVGRDVSRGFIGRIRDRIAGWLELRRVERGARVLWGAAAIVIAETLRIPRGRFESRSADQSIGREPETPRMALRKVFLPAASRSPEWKLDAGQEPERNRPGLAPGPADRGCDQHHGNSVHPPNRAAPPVLKDSPYS